MRTRSIVWAGCVLLLAALAWASSNPDGSHGRHRAAGQEPAPRVVILETVGGVSHFTVTGTTDEFGRYLALGEATFVAGQEEGVVLDGTGIAVVQAEDGAQIVADVTCRATDHGFDVTFHWRDSVTFSNGSTVSNTGEFVDHRPPGLALTSISGLSFNDTRASCWFEFNCNVTPAGGSCACFTHCCYLGPVSVCPFHYNDPECACGGIIPGKLGCH